MKSGKKSIIFRAAAFLLCLVLLQPFGVRAAITEDQGIVSDPVSGVYRGLMLGDTIRQNLNFADLGGHWAKEAVSRLGALGIVQGYSEGGRYYYRPNQLVSKEEALALLLRTIGKEADAKKAAEGIEAGETVQSNLTFWSKGYLTVARRLGAITEAQLNDALAEDQSALLPVENFRRLDIATREEVAAWLVKLASAAGSTELVPQYENQAIFRYSDWQNIKAEYLPYVEMVTRAGIMKGSGNAFAPKRGITRAEMAQAIRNMGQTLYRLRNITMKDGYVGHIADDTTLNNQTSKKERNYLVRNQTGQVDKLIYAEEISSDNQKTILSAPVLRYGTLSTMLALKEGDKVEYLVDDKGGLLYVSAKEPDQPYSFSGSLQPFDLDKGQIILKDGENSYHFTMTPSLYRRNPDQVALKIQYNDRFVPLASLPYSHRVTVTVKDKLVTEIYYQGDIIRTNEVSGIIKDIQPDFKYIVIETWDSKLLTKKYNASELTIEKRPYYENNVNSGYFDELFRHYRFDPYDGKITDLEVGDIVHALLSEEDEEYITRISASTNYVADFGQIVDVRDGGDAGSQITIRRSDESLNTYTVAPLVGVFYGEERSSLARLQAGQTVKLLINQAVISPGTLKETVKEIAVDKLGNQVANIYKGNIGLLNQAQKQLTLNHSYQLQYNRWDNYQASRVFQQNEQTKYYYNGQRVTADYVRKFLYSKDMTGYAVTTQFYSGEILDTLSFRDSRETMLARDRIETVRDNSRLTLEDWSAAIQTDDGTIILKDNHVVSFGSLLPPDYARVILNGENQAALIEVTAEPGNGSLQIFRGRIAKINEMQGFKLQSNAALKGMNWVYSPIKREFEMDHNTRIYSGEGFINQSKFLSYGEVTHTDKVYNIISDGAKANYVLEQPYLQEGVKGTIYAIDGDGIKIKDVFVYQRAQKKWVPLSLSNSYAVLTVHASALFFRENKATEKDSLKVGEVLRAMTTKDLIKSVKDSSDRTVEGYLFFVEQ